MKRGNRQSNLVFTKITNDVKEIRQVILEEKNKPEEDKGLKCVYRMREMEVLMILMEGRIIGLGNSDWVLALIREKQRMTKFMTCVIGYKMVQLIVAGNKELSIGGRIFGYLELLGKYLKVYVQ